MTNETNPGTVEVTQADRDTAAQALTEWYGAGGNCRYDFSKVVKDDHPFTQAFARHRLAAQSQPAATVQEVGRELHAAATDVLVRWDALTPADRSAKVRLRVALTALTAEPAAKAGDAEEQEPTGYLVDGAWTTPEEYRSIKYPEAHRVEALFAAPPSPQPDMGSGEAEAERGGLGELIEALQMVTPEQGTVVFDHTPEEIGIMVMENHHAVLAALQPQTIEASPVATGTDAPELVAAEPRRSEEDEDEDGNPVWQVEIQTVGGWSVIANVWGVSQEQASSRAQKIIAALSPASQSVERLREALEAIKQEAFKREAMPGASAGKEAVRNVMMALSGRLGFIERTAREALSTLSHKEEATPARATVALVIAAREAWEKHGASGDDLDRALEPFAALVPYENEPEAK